MNPDEREALVRRAYETWNANDPEATLELFDPDGYYRSARAFPDLQAEYSGHAGLWKFWEDFRAPWEEIRVELERAEAVGEITVVTTRFSATGRDGMQVEQVFHFAFEFSDDLILGFTGERELEDARKDARELSELESNEAQS